MGFSPAGTGIQIPGGGPHDHRHCVPVQRADRGSPYPCMNWTGAARWCGWKRRRGRRNGNNHPQEQQRSSARAQGFFKRVKSYPN